MSKKTIARRYDVNSYSQEQRDELIQHLIAGTQPQRRIFLGKTDNFADKEEAKYYKKMLKAYLKGAVVFYHGKTKRPVMITEYDKKLKTKVVKDNGRFEEVPAPVLVKQMYFFN